MRMSVTTWKITRILLILAMVAMVWRPAMAQTWSNGYAYRRAITIDHTKVPNTDQSNFPILITGTYSYLATIPNGGDVTSSNGYDITFTSDAAGTTTLAFEREAYSAADGTVTFWIKIPTLSHTSDTSIYMFYGNGAVSTDSSNKTAVWDSNFAGVWHLPNGTTLSAADSTSNANNGTISNATATASVIDGGAAFSGSSQYINAGNGSSVQITGSAITVDTWLKTSESNPSLYERIIAKEIAGNNDPWITYCLCRIAGTNHVGFGVSHATAGSNVGANSAYSLTMGTWTHVVGTYDGSSIKIYFNGVLDTTVSETGNIGSTSQPLVFGGDTAANTEYFDGALDEVRISNTARSADWIVTEYNNESSPSTFSTIGAADTTGSGGSPTPTVSSLSPTSGPVTTTVLIAGNNFGASQGTSTVTFNNVAATPTTWTGAGILARVPSGATTGNVVVTVGGVSGT